MNLYYTRQLRKVRLQDLEHYVGLEADHHRVNHVICWIVHDLREILWTLNHNR